MIMILYDDIDAPASDIVTPPPRDNRTDRLGDAPAQHARPVPCRATAARFLARLDPSPDARFLFALYDDYKPTKDEPPRRPKLSPAHRHGTLDQHWADLCRLNARGYGLFVTVNTTPGAKREATDVTAVRAVWVDLDNGLPNRTAAPIPPSMIIESSPGKQHWYWSTDPADPVPVDAGPRLNRAAAAVLGGDRAAVDLSRVLRLPGTLHMKGEPGTVHLARDLTPDGDVPRYGYAALAAAFPRAADTRDAPTAPAAPFDADRVASMLAALPTTSEGLTGDDQKRGWRDWWLRIGMGLHHAGGGSDAAFDVWHAWSSEIDGYAGEADCQTRWRSLKQGRGGTVTLKTVESTARRYGWRDPAIAAALPAIDPASPVADPDVAEWVGALPDGYTVGPGGIWRTVHRRDGATGAWLCAPIRVLARMRDSAGAGQALRVEFHTTRDGSATCVIPRADLCGDGAAARAALAGAGLEFAIGRDGWPALQKLLWETTPDRWQRTHTQCGWTAAGAFVLPDGAFAPASDTDYHVFEGDPDTVAALAPSGTVAGWQEAARLAFGNSRLMLAICTGLAAPMAHRLGCEAPSFHLRGNTSCGKSTAVRLMASVSGTDGLIGSWNTTQAGAEARFAAFRDLAIGLDEIGEGVSERVQEIAYMAGNGRGRARGAKTGGRAAPTTWRIAIGSTGEKTIAAHINAGRGPRARAGVDVRLLDIEADAGAGHATLDVLHEHPTGRALAAALTAAMDANRGQALRALLPQLVRDASWVDEASALMAEWTARHATGEVAARRVAAKFALLAAAGELATRRGVLPWGEGEAAKVMARLYQEWLAAHGDGASPEARAALDAVVRAATTMRDARFELWGHLSLHRLPVRWGYHYGEGATRQLRIYSTAWDELLGDDVDPKQASRALSATGVLLPGYEGRPTRALKIPGAGSARFYVIDLAALETVTGCADAEPVADDGRLGVQHLAAIHNGAGALQ